MRGLRRGIVGGVVLLGFGVCAVDAADREGRGRAQKTPPEKESKWGWVNPANWFGSKEKPKEKAADAKRGKAGKKDAAAGEDLAPLPTPADEARGRRNREEADLLRRLAVCDQLREVALRNDDHTLLQRVDELADRVFVVYTQRTGGSPATGTGLEAELRGLERGGDDAAALLRRPREEPIHSVTSGAPRRPDVKGVDR